MKCQTYLKGHHWRRLSTDEVHDIMRRGGLSGCVKCGIVVRLYGIRGHVCREEVTVGGDRQGD
jgi:hypothetical protein